MIALNQQILKHLIVVLSCVLFSACEQSSEKIQSGLTADQGEVLVWVNEEPIYQAELDHTLTTTFRGTAGRTANAEVKKKVLDSLIAARGMRHHMQKTLDVDKQQDIEQQVKAYREELYVKQYLSQYATPAPVTTAMIQEYYQQNQKRFLRPQIKTYEMLKAKRPLKEKERDALIAMHSGLSGNKKWKSQADKIAKKIPFQYIKAKSTEKILDPALTKVLQNLEVGQTSNVVFIKDKPHVIRLIEQSQAVTKSLAEVSGEIRKKLAPRQIKTAVKKATDTVIGSVKLHYPKEKN